MGGEGGARNAPFGGGSELKKTGARSARARTRGQKPTSETDLFESQITNGLFYLKRTTVCTVGPTLILPKMLCCIVYLYKLIFV